MNDPERLADGLVFKYSQAPYEINLQVVDATIRQNKAKLEEMIKERFDPFWLELETDGFASASFPLDKSRVWVRSRQDQPGLCEITVKSQDLIDRSREIGNEYFPGNSPGKLFSVKETLRRARDESLGVPVPNFELINPEFDVNRLVDGLGLDIDPKVRGLISVLNKLGIFTVQSCEGHEGRGLEYPWIDIAMVSLPKFLSIFSVIGDELEDGVMTPYVEDFRLRPVEKMDLLQGQMWVETMARKFADHAGIKL